MLNQIYEIFFGKSLRGEYMLKGVGRIMRTTQPEDSQKLPYNEWCKYCSNMLDRKQSLFTKVW